MLLFEALLFWEQLPDRPRKETLIPTAAPASTLSWAVASSVRSARGPASRGRYHGHAPRRPRPDAPGASVSAAASDPRRLTVCTCSAAEGVSG